MYEQSLYKIIEPIRANTIKRLNKGKKWEYLAYWLYGFFLIMFCVKLGIFDPMEYTPSIYYVSTMGGSLVLGIFCMIMGIGFWEFMKLPTGPVGDG